MRQEYFEIVTMKNKWLKLMIMKENYKQNDGKKGPDAKIEM